MIFNILKASYGSEDRAKHIDVTSIVQQLVNKSPVITVTNQTMDGDPNFGTHKYFSAIVSINGGMPKTFECHEGETIDFSK
ncbi:hypothetical protein [Tenacibaculum sp. UWU-22]|uniref:hypothetical protein n=1 Tax=Tenacibaculum sp. UWU-22 TaxID=3234187 RepID=UPI0034DB1705